MLQLQPLIKDWKAANLEIVMVTSDSPAEISAFLEQNPMQVTVLFDSRRDVGRLYRVSGIPDGYLVDQEGKLRYNSKSWGSGSLNELQEQIEKVLH